MTIAVVIAAYDAEPWVAQAIASVRAQSAPVAEIVVVDDGSRDRTADVAAGAGARVLRQANSGPGAARNAGVAATTSPLLAFLDADDRFEPDKLARQLPALEDRAVPGCACDAWRVTDGSRRGRCNERRRVPARITYADLLERNPIVASTMLLRRDAFERAGGFDPDRRLIAVEDYDLWLRVARLGPIAYVDAPLADYRVQPGSLGANERFVPGLDRIAEKLRADDPSPATAKRIDRRRAQARVDLAWDRVRAGRGAEARALLREARQLGGGARALRIWLRSWLARAP